MFSFKSFFFPTSHKVCSLDCQNGGTLDENDCSCSCPSGWHGTDCSSKYRLKLAGPLYGCSNSVCSLDCQNGSTLDEDDCSCLCPSGWHGTDCSSKV